MSARALSLGTHSAASTHSALSRTHLRSSPAERLRGIPLAPLHGDTVTGVTSQHSAGASAPANFSETTVINDFHVKERRELRMHLAAIRTVLRRIRGQGCRA